MANYVKTDAQLINEYINGNEAALNNLIVRHQKAVFQFILNKTLDEDLSNDLFQETFIKVINTLKHNNYSEKGLFLPWVLRISRNLIIDHYRFVKKMPMNRDYEDGSVFDGLNLVNEETVDPYEILKEEESVFEALKYLKNDQREIIIFRFFENKSFKEIAELNNESINTSLGRMRYALKNLSKIIENRNNRTA